MFHGREGEENALDSARWLHSVLGVPKVKRTPGSRTDRMGGLSELVPGEWVQGLGKSDSGSANRIAMQRP